MSVPVSVPVSVLVSVPVSVALSTADAVVMPSLERGAGAWRRAQLIDTQGELSPMDGCRQKLCLHLDAATELSNERRRRCERVGEGVREAGCAHRCMPERTWQQRAIVEHVGRGWPRRYRVGEAEVEVAEEQLCATSVPEQPRLPKSQLE